MPYERVGERIRERLIALRYVKPDGELDVERFCWDGRLGRTNLYNWIGDKAVPFKDLIRLCRALQCSADWLLTGEEPAVPKAPPARGRQRGKLRSLLLALAVGGALMPSPSGGDSPQGHALRDGSALDAIRLIGRTWRRRFNSGYFGLGTVYA